MLRKIARPPHELTGAQAIDDTSLVSFGGETIEAASDRSVTVKRSQESKQMSKIVSRFVKDESGATAIEYGLIAALISVVIIAVLTTVGDNLETKFSEIGSALD